MWRVINDGMGEPEERNCMMEGGLHVESIVVVEWSLGGRVSGKERGGGGIHGREERFIGLKHVIIICTMNMHNTVHTHILPT